AAIFQPPPTTLSAAITAAPYPRLVRSSRLKRTVQRRGERNAIVHTITCRRGPNCRMLSLHPCSACSGPITFARAFYLRAGVVGSKAQCCGGRAATGGKSPYGSSPSAVRGHEGHGLSEHRHSTG